MSDSKESLLEIIKFDIKITDEVKVSTSLDKLVGRIGELTDGFDSLKSLLKGGIGIKDISNGLSELGNKMTTLEKGVVGATAVFAEFSLVKDGMYELVSGTDNLIDSLGKVAGGATAAAVALYTAFGPAGLVASAIVGVIGLIAGIYDAFQEINAEKLGESIKEGLSNPGGVRLEELVEDVIGSIEEIGDSFIDISEKTAALESAEENVSSLVSEIEKIKTSMEEGAISTETATAKIVESCNELAAAIVVKMGAAGDVLLSVFAEDGMVAQAFEATGKNVDFLLTTTVQTMTEKEQKAKDILNEIYELYKNNPGDPNILEKYKQLAQLRNGISETDEAMTKLELTANRGLNWSTYINENGVNITALENSLNGMIQACGNVRERAENDLTAAVTSVQELGSEELKEYVMDGIPAALDYIDEQAAIKAISITDTMQTDLIQGLEDVIADAKKRWNEMSFQEQSRSGFESMDLYVQAAVNEYKARYIDPIAQTIEEQYAQLGIEGAGWASEAADKIIGGLFYNTTDYTNDMLGSYVIKLQEDYKTVIGDVTEELYEQMKERGNYTVLNYNKGIAEGISDSEDAVEEWMQSVLGTVETALDSHSPSKAMIEYGLYTVQGYNQGIRENEGSSVHTVCSYINNVMQPFDTVQEKMYKFGISASNGFSKGICENMYSVGVNVMKGFLNGIESLEIAIYDKISEIANSVTKTISDALQIASPSRVMYKLGVYTMEGFQGGMESIYENTYKSLYEFCYHISEPQMIYPDYSVEYFVNNGVSNILQAEGTQHKDGGMEILLPYLVQIAQNTKESASKEFSVNIGDRNIARANNRGQRSLGYKIMAEI